jgi:hypothetical protein
MAKPSRDGEVSTPRRVIRGGVSEMHRPRTIDRTGDYDGCYFVKLTARRARHPFIA